MRYSLPYAVRCLLAFSAILTIIIVGPGCDGEPEVRETIRELRVLGIQAEPPEAKPGSQVKLDTLAVIVPTAAITYTWYACDDPDKALDGCHLAGGKELGQNTQASLTIPANYLEAASTKDPAIALRGRYFFVTLVAKSGDQEIVATKRIVVTTTPTNQNPTLAPLKVYQKDGTTPQSSPFAAAVEASIKLQPTLVDGARQSYEIIDPNGQKSTVQEQLYYSWYTTEGIYKKGYLSQEDAPENTWIAPKEKPTEPEIKLFLILRDGRGGITWQTTPITIQ